MEPVNPPAKKPLSEAQLRQRRDAAKQANKNKTGPKTKAGKRRSSQNSWKHGSLATSAKAATHGKPCLSTCPKFDECAFIKAGKTKPGGKCLDVMDWQIVEECASAIVAAQDGDLSEIAGIQAIVLGQNFAILQQVYAFIAENGAFMRKDMRNADGDIIGSEMVENPALATFTKMLDKSGINMQEMVATPKAQAQLAKDESDMQTAAEITRQHLSRLLPDAMVVPDFSTDEIVDAEIVEETHANPPE